MCPSSPGGGRHENGPKLKSILADDKLNEGNAQRLEAEDEE